MRKVSWFGGILCGAVLLGAFGVARMASGQCCGGGGGGDGAGCSVAPPTTNSVPAGCAVTTNGTTAVTNAVPRVSDPTPVAPVGSVK